MRICTFLKLLLVAAVLQACQNNPVEVIGYQPVYEDSAVLRTIAYQAGGQPVLNGGKIYVLGDTVYQVEYGKGVHIIDISDKEDPQKRGFITIPGCKEVAARGHTIYANNYSELVALQLSGGQLQVLQRQPDIFMNDEPFSLPPERGYFVCPVDIPGKKITGWTKVKITDPKCFY